MRLTAAGSYLISLIPPWIAASTLRVFSEELLTASTFEVNGTFPGRLADHVPVNQFWTTSNSLPSPVFTLNQGIFAVAPFHIGTIANWFMFASQLWQKCAALLTTACPFSTRH